MDERERASLTMDGCIFQGRMSRERQERIFRLRMYETPAAAWEVIRPDLLKMLDVLEGLRGGPEFLGALATATLPSGIHSRYSMERLRSILTEKELL